MAKEPEGPEHFWNSVYETRSIETLPWYLEALDPDIFSELQRLQIAAGKNRTALDLGTGPGTQALRLAELGFDVTASDLAASAVEQAKRLASTTKSPGVHFLQDDILATRLSARFDLIVDRGCFHVLPPKSREQYAKTIVGLLAPAGWFFLKTFSLRQPDSDTGPYRFSREELESIFSKHLHIERIVETNYQGPGKSLDGKQTGAPHALFVTLRHHR